MGVRGEDFPLAGMSPIPSLVAVGETSWGGVPGVDAGDKKGVLLADRFPLRCLGDTGDIMLRLDTMGDAFCGEVRVGPEVPLGVVLRVLGRTTPEGLLFNVMVSIDGHHGSSKVRCSPNFYTCK